ncbi:MAG: DUF72 domain-containing protein [Sphingomonadales bacterium]|nr:MAG: DUF72 domain-containing protein [Sphingomonadales bacterium]
MGPDGKTNADPKHKDSLDDIWGTPAPKDASWFDTEADALLIEQHIARVAADPAPAPAATEPGGWRGLAYFRLHGSPRPYWSSYESTLPEWAARIKASGAESWVTLDNTASGAATADALAFQALL